MAGIKRPLAHSDEADAGAIHPSRKRRVEYGEGDAKLAKAYNDLADEVLAVRIKAAGTLVRELSQHAPDQAQRIDAALTRLIKGLCSGRKAARLGFSMVLPEVLRLAFGSAADQSKTTLTVVTEKVVPLTHPDGKLGGQERREYLLGRRFAFQAILQSQIAQSPTLPRRQWQAFLEAVLDLAAAKPWLRTECGAMLYAYLEGSESAGLNIERVQDLIETLRQRSMIKTAEGVALWLAIADRWPEALPKGVWHRKDPLSAEERALLKKALLGGSQTDEEDKSTRKPSASGTRQAQPSFVWKAVLGRLYKRQNHTDFARFWDGAVQYGLLAKDASAERKALGLQVVAMAVREAPIPYLPFVLDQNIIQNVMAQRADPARYLFETAKLVLDSIVARGSAGPHATPALMQPLLAQGAFDQQTRTETIDALVRCTDESSLDDLITVLRDFVMKPEAENGSQADNRRRTCSTILQSLLKTHRPKATSPWLEHLLELLVDVGYRSLTGHSAPAPGLSDAVRTEFRSRLASCLVVLMDQGLELAARAFGHITKTLEAHRKTLSKPLQAREQEAVNAAEEVVRSRVKIQEQGSEDWAFELLLGILILQMYNGEGDTSTLEDLAAITREENGTEVQSEALVEILLGVISQPSTLSRKIGETVFESVAPSITAESLQSLLELLSQKEDSTGQQQLFENQDDGDGSEGEEDDAIDADDMSDVELVNGETASPGEESEEGEDSEGSDGRSHSDSGSDAELITGEDELDDEEAEFDRKLAEALGDAGMAAGDSDDDSDMDDDQMMALDSHLTNVFKERKKESNKKKANKEAKVNVVNFKNRVLDLLSIYVRKQASNPLALDVILPVTMLVRTTESPPTAKKASELLVRYFKAAKKAKTLPKPDDAEACFEVLASLHAEMRFDKRTLHTEACSRSSIFLSRVLMAMDDGKAHFERIKGMYDGLRREFEQGEKSGLRESIFADWKNFCSTASTATIVAGVLRKPYGQRWFRVIGPVFIAIQSSHDRLLYAVAPPDLAVVRHWS